MIGGTSPYTHWSEVFSEIQTKHYRRSEVVSRYGASPHSAPTVRSTRRSSMHIRSTSTAAGAASACLLKSLVQSSIRSSLSHIVIARLNHSFFVRPELRIWSRRRKEINRSLPRIFIALAAPTSLSPRAKRDMRRVPLAAMTADETDRFLQLALADQSGVALVW